MENSVGSIGEKRGAEEGERDGSDSEGRLGYGFQPQKVVRTATQPFRMMGSDPTLYYSGGEPYETARPLQHPLRASSLCYTGLDMGAGGVAGLRCFPFTPAQWQELQRQAMIYKHFMASVPVPAELLASISASSYFNMAGRGGGSRSALLRFGNGLDPEPGRCRRTDGKKWRCSRDAAPGQRYCERHVHRGRPRSRKPVEQQKTKSISTATATINSPKATVGVNPSLNASPTTVAIPFPLHPSCFLPNDKEPRYSEWMKGNEENWYVKERKIGLSSLTSPSIGHYDHQLNLNHADLNDPCAFLKSDLTSLEEEETINASDVTETPRNFIDAWSAEKTSMAYCGQLPLSLSVSGGDEDGDHIDMSLSLNDAGGRAKTWMAHGPLGEVLQTSNVTSPQHNSSSSKGSFISTAGFINLMDKEVSPQGSPTTLASSSSGHLQKNLVSYSDSSCTSSLSFVAAASRPEFTLQWMNHPK